MTKQTLTIWCNAELPPPLGVQFEQRLGGHRLIGSKKMHKSNLAAAASEEEARGAEVLFGQPNPEDILHSTALRWVHLTTAGYTRYDNSAVRDAIKSRGAVMTNSSSVFADPCAEHLLSFMLCNARMLPTAILNGAGPRGWPYFETREYSRLLRGQRAVIVGYGSIGRRLTELLAPFHLKLSAVRRTVSGKEPVPTLPTAQLDSAIADVDHVINILPAAEGTAKLFNADRFSKMKPGTVFYNIGRGDTVDQAALCDALNSGHLAAAYLDVTTPEPLPPDHPLWQAKHCYITPHTAGGYDTEFAAIADHFLGNLKRFEDGEEMVDRIV